MKNLLDVRDLIVEIKNREKSWKVIRRISFALKDGEKLGIVGESGSGKTVLMRSILKLLPPSISLSSGTVEYQGQLLSNMTDRELRKIRGKEIGMVFQDPLTFLNPTLKIGAQITEGYLFHFPKASKRQAFAKAVELLTQVGVAEPELRLSQYPHELSGGLRQRVLIAIALVAQPHLLIADEPTSALDVTVQAQILELLAKINKSTILITHDLSLVALFCDRVIVMYAGQIVEDASIDKLFKTPQHPYTQQLLKSIPTLSTHDKLVTIPGSPPDLSQPIQGCSFAPRCSSAYTQCTKPPPLFQKNNHKTLCWLKNVYH